MIKLFEFLFHGCSHKWETIRQYGIHGYDSTGEISVIGEVVECRCEKCGRPKAFRIR